MKPTVNVLIVGIGGQGVLKASQVLSDVLVRQGFDVKQSEVHGMAQRGGSVVSEVRFGEEVFSPVTGQTEADYVVVLEENEGKRAVPRLRAGTGKMVEVPPDTLAALPDPRSRNMAALGRLSAFLDIEEPAWLDAIKACMPATSVETNVQAFKTGRALEG